MDPTLKDKKTPIRTVDQRPRPLDVSPVEAEKPATFKAVCAWFGAWWKAIGVCATIVGGIWMWVITPIANEYHQNHANAAATQASAVGMVALNEKVDLLKLKRDAQLDGIVSTGQALGEKVGATITRVEVTNAKVEALTRSQDEINSQLRVIIPLLRSQASAPHHLDADGEYVTAPAYGPPRPGAQQ